MIRYRIPLTGLKVSTNKIYAGQHWTKRKGSADAVTSIAGYFCRPVQKIGSYPVEICYKFIFGSRALDTTNCAYMVKMFEDALRTLEILTDDSPQYVARTIIESSKFDGPKRPKAAGYFGAKANAKDEDWLEITINSL